MPRIYVASLTDYNAGTLHGTWIGVDGTTEADDIREQIANMLKQSPEARKFPQDGPAEEAEIHDHEGWEGLDPANYNIEQLPEIAKGIETHGKMFAEILTGGYVDEQDPQAALAFIAENYRGTFASLEDWARDFLEETGALDGIPENLRSYFDFQSWARDADVFTIRTSEGLAVFDNS